MLVELRFLFSDHFYLYLFFSFEVDYLFVQFLYAVLCKSNQPQSLLLLLRPLLLLELLQLLILNLPLHLQVGRPIRPHLILLLHGNEIEPILLLLTLLLHPLVHMALVLLQAVHHGLHIGCATQRATLDQPLDAGWLLPMEGLAIERKIKYCKRRHPRVTSCAVNEDLLLSVMQLVEESGGLEELLRVLV